MARARLRRGGFAGEADEVWITKGGGVAGVIHGSFPNKSNSRRILRIWTRRGGRRQIVAKSEEAVVLTKRFEHLVLRAGIQDRLPLVGASSAQDLKDGYSPLYLKATVYGNFLRDLDLELLPDLLQKSGVITNDRAIRRKSYEWRYEARSPRVDWEVGFFPADAVAGPGAVKGGGPRGGAARREA